MYSNALSGKQQAAGSRQQAAVITQRLNKRIILKITKKIKFNVVKRRVGSYTHIRHIMLYHFEKGWKAGQGFSDLNKLLGSCVQVLLVYAAAVLLSYLFISISYR
uniref:Mos1 transposase HTH domain-containing protein n=1 Tax=Glossina palpalis gambiensis TaxID=67801 RepID=A0A1B0B019_9MUSC